MSMPAAQSFTALIFIVAAASLMQTASARSTPFFMEKGELGQYVEDSLLRQLALASNMSKSGDFQILKNKLRPLFNTAPQNADKTLPHESVRDVLYRFFASRGWFLDGLQPVTAPKKTNDKRLLLFTVAHDAPNALIIFLEKLHPGRGAKLAEIAVLAQTLDSLVHDEARWRLGKCVRKWHAYHEKGQFDKAFTEKEVGFMMTSYMMSYISGRIISARSPLTLVQEKELMGADVNWATLDKWMLDVKREVHPDGRPILYEDVVRIVGALQQRFAAYNDKECSALRVELTHFEAKKSGRVRLTDFYKHGLSAEGGKFDLTLDYLRHVGAIDESEPRDPLIIISNYLNSGANCKGSSDFYSLCCRSDCVDILSRFEDTTGEGFLTAGKIVEIVTTAGAPRTLSSLLIRHLDSIAERHNGQVPIHGRLFAQWMHHAFPRECPFPNAAGVITTSPEEFHEATGVSARLSEEEVLSHLDSHESDFTGYSPVGSTTAEPHPELEWHNAAEALGAVPMSQPPSGPKTSVGRRLLVLGMLLSLTWAAMSMVSSAEDKSYDAKMV